MKHLGDVTKISGYEIEPVDVLTGGSPCQDLSVAGLRKGLKHEELDDEETTRSGLFMEQIRIAKEMRERDRLLGRSGVDVRCRYFVWENVCGAYSSNGGRDFQTVLTEIIRVADPAAPDVPLPDGGWPKYGCYYSEMGSWSLAYRTVDAQFFGTPQRRKRIALICDFNGLTAPEILFDPQLRGETARKESDETIGSDGGEHPSKISTVCESLHGYSEPGREAGEKATAGAERNFGETGGTISENGTAEEVTGDMSCANPWDSQANRVYYGDGAWHSLFANNGGGQTKDAVLAFTENQRNEGLELRNGEERPTEELQKKPQHFAAGFSFGQSAQARSLGYQKEVSPTLRGGEGGNQKPVVLEYYDKNAK